MFVNPQLKLYFPFHSSIFQRCFTTWSAKHRNDHHQQKQHVFPKHMEQWKQKQRNTLFLVACCLLVETKCNTKPYCISMKGRGDWSSHTFSKKWSEIFRFGYLSTFQEISNRTHWTDPSTWVSNSSSNLLRGPLVRSHSFFWWILGMPITAVMSTKQLRALNSLSGEIRKYQKSTDLLLRALEMMLWTKNGDRYRCCVLWCFGLGCEVMLCRPYIKIIFLLLYELHNGTWVYKYCSRCFGRGISSWWLVYFKTKLGRHSFDVKTTYIQCGCQHLVGLAVKHITEVLISQCQDH